ncbi:YbaK/EbsC family protein [Desulfoferrobacter suflitae]|uniref:YbaK/EbsC family protein n=1 Tax=Desulfoferrobacter suflitae TaxID=2865782 RepID=UPI0021644F03|nr:YbaK/EbsC family protein [Desulfoferrobacter suflitae]MCK8600834.1 YbaK/EbsC family protein [Desulfoferrobacter suflitae]
MPTIAEVKSFLATQNIQVMEFQQPTPTSETAAQAVGCSVGEIAKTILFIVGTQPVVVVTCGDLKIKGSRLKQAAQLTGKVRLPQADEVVHYTGYEPGGVCPFLLPPHLTVLIDRSMRRFPRVFAAAGNANSAVPITVDQLLDMTGGLEVEVCE